MTESPSACDGVPPDQPGQALPVSSLRVACMVVALSAAVSVSSVVAQVGYTWANQPSAAQYEPHPLYSYNPAGGRITISRTGTGAYTVQFAGLGGKGKGGGHVQVTSYGDNSDTCKVMRWGHGSPDFVVEVRCFDARGAAVDSRFTVLAGWLAEQQLSSGAGGDLADPVQRLVLGDGTTELRYRDGTIRRLTSTCTVVIPPSGTPDTMCIARAEVPLNLPPLSDQSPRGLRAWIQVLSDQLMLNITTLLRSDPASVNNYQSTEEGLDLYKRVERRQALVTRLLLGR